MIFGGLLKMATWANAVTKLHQPERGVDRLSQQVGEGIPEASAVRRLRQLERGVDRPSRQTAEEIPAASAETVVRQTLPRRDDVGSMLRQGSAAAHQRIGRLAGRITRLTETRRDLPSVGHLWWALKLWVQRLGVAGVVGLGLCAFAVMFYFSAVLILQEEQAQVLEELETSRSLAQGGTASPTNVPRTPAEQLADFYAVFPPVTARPETLRKIIQLAERQTLVLRAGKYHVIDDHTGRLVRYEVSFPIVGPYPNVRQFLRAVLAEVPSAALDKVDVQKNMADGAHAKTTVSFTLFSRRDG